MPEVRKTTRPPHAEPGRNGETLPVPGRIKDSHTALGRYFRARRQRDDVKIGSPDYVHGQEDDTQSWADVAERVKGVRWLIPQWLPYRLLSGTIAEPKAGKSSFALDGLCRPILTGCSWFNGFPGPEPGYAVWADTEGSAGLNIERAKRGGLPLDRIKVPFPDDPFQCIDLDNGDHMTRLLNVVCRYRARLVVVDSFRGSHSGDENNSRIVRGLLNLTKVAEQTGAAVNIIHHTRKMGEGEELTPNSGRGSNVFLAMVRVQLAVDRPDPQSPWRRVRVLGENFGTAPQPIGFRFTPTGLQFGPAPERARRVTEKDEAAQWLRERMQAGKAYTASELLAEAAQYGHALRTVQRAATDLLGIKPKPVRKDGQVVEWRWVRKR